jgi:hypothetical protein
MASSLEPWNDFHKKDNMMKKPNLQRVALAPVALAAMFACGAQAQTSDDVATQMRQLRDEVRQLKAELEAVKRQQQSAVPAPAAAAPATGWNAQPAAAQAAPAAATADGNAGQGVSLFGYGELNYTRPRHDAAATTATAARGVLGFGYRFNERTRMAAEIEIENAVVSADDQGEVAFEQLYVEHDLSDRISAKAGLFLMPVGILNEVHEPTRYYGVFRNFVETAIIPTTWRELGLGLHGTTTTGLRWDAGVATGFDLTKWDPTSDEGRESPLGSIHQEGQLARARTLAGYGALNYNGIPGLNLGGSLYHGGAGQKQPGFAGTDATVTLSEVHARWQPGRWDLSALVASGSFNNVEALNATFAGQPTPVPDRFGGWYAQAAYRVWQSGEYSLSPFARYERFNTAKGYSGIPDGLAPAVEPDTRVWTAGASFYLSPQVVIKGDLQRFASDRSRDRFNLGVGFHF